MADLDQQSEAGVAESPRDSIDEAETRELTTTATSTRRAGWYRWLAYAFLAAVLALVGRELVRGFRAMDWSSIELRPGMLALAVVLVALQTLLWQQAAFVLLRDMGSGLNWSRTMAVLLVARLGRYIPGKIATFATATALFRRQNVSLGKAMSALLLTPALSLLTLLILGVPVLLTMHFENASSRTLWIPAMGLAIAGILLLNPWSMRLGYQLAKRLSPRAKALRPVGYGSFFIAILNLLLSCATLGTAVWVAAIAIAPVDLATWHIFVGATVLAGISGLLAFFAPAGIGVVDGVYFLMLSPVLGPRTALLVVMIRLVRAAVDLVMGLTSMPLLGRQPAIANLSVPVDAGVERH